MRREVPETKPFGPITRSTDEEYPTDLDGFSVTMTIDEVSSRAQSAETLVDSLYVTPPCSYCDRRLTYTYLPQNRRSLTSCS